MKTTNTDRLWTMLKPGGTFPFVSALVLVSFATLVRVPFQRVLGDASPFLFYWPCVLTAAVGFGLKPGLLATAVAAVQADYFWMPPHRALSLNKVEFLQLLTFCFGSVSLACLSEWLQRERGSKEQFRATLANAGGAIITTDGAARISYLNATAQAMTGLTNDEAQGQPISSALCLLHRPDRRPIDHVLQQLLVEDEAERLPHDLLLVGKTAKEYPVKATISRIVNPQGQKTGHVIVFQTWPPSEEENRPGVTGPVRAPTAKNG